MNNFFHSVGLLSKWTEVFSVFILSAYTYLVFIVSLILGSLKPNLSSNYSKLCNLFWRQGSGKQNNWESFIIGFRYYLLLSRTAANFKPLLVKWLQKNNLNRTIPKIPKRILILSSKAIAFWPSTLLLFPEKQFFQSEASSFYPVEPSYKDSYKTSWFFCIMIQCLQ